MPIGGSDRCSFGIGRHLVYLPGGRNGTTGRTRQNNDSRRHSSARYGSRGSDFD